LVSENLIYCKVC